MKKNNITIPVVIISNSGQPVDIDRAIKLGACDYLVKAEFEPAEVVEKIRRCLIIKRDNGSGKHKSKTILIIEDDKFLRDLCIRRFDQMGFKIDFAGDGLEGMRKIIDNKPNLVLLDIIIPGIEGFELLKKIRAHKDKTIAKIPIIVLSNLGQESDMGKAMSLGANEYFIKAHFDIDDIANKVKKYL
ncbi:response regulator [Candidatus Parcubacteria bacterium]|nr:response regulator [Candidatus Parcubacteria bacterium]